MVVSQRSGLFLGIALVTCATVLLELALTRLCAALFGEPLALLAPSLSLLGAGLGGVLLSVVPSLVRSRALFARLSALSALASGATALSVIVLLELRPVTELDPRSLLWLALAYVTSTLPFLLIGVAIAAAVRHVALEMPRLYLVHLAGAAAGGLVGLAALRVGAPRAVLIAAVVLSASSLFFYLASRCAAEERRASGGLVATFVLGTSVLLAGDLGAPWLKLRNLRWMMLDRVEFQSWSEQALITVDRARTGAAWMRLDGTSASAILDARTSPPIHPDDMAYALHQDLGPVLVVGAGGGRDVRAALKAGQKDVYAVESDRVVVDGVMRDRYADYSDHLFDKPEVHVAVADGRSYVRQTRVLFRNIVLSATDSSAAADAGAQALSASRLFTVEAFRDLLDRLTPEGTLVVNRGDREFDRLLSLSAAALRRIGAELPRDHLFACGLSRSTSLLIKRTPLDGSEIDALRRHCRKNKFAEVFAPDRRQTRLRTRLVTLTDAREADPDAELDLSPPTDDRPFFFYNVPPRRLPAALRDLPSLKVVNTGLFSLVSLLAGSLGLGVLCLLVPLFFFRRRASAARALDAGVAGDLRAPRRPALFRSLLFFAALGAGFALVEIGFVQHLVALLGHPARSVPVALGILLVSGGAGSLLTARVAPVAAAGAAATLAELLVAGLGLAAVGLGPLLEWSLGFAFGARLALVLALLMPLGLLVGSLAPLGIKLVAASAPSLIPWCWGLGAVAGLSATAAGVLLAMNLGYSVLLLGAGVAYLVAAAAVPPPAAAGRSVAGAEASAPPVVPGPALIS